MPSNSVELPQQLSLFAHPSAQSIQAQQKNSFLSTVVYFAPRDTRPYSSDSQTWLFSEVRDFSRAFEQH